MSRSERGRGRGRSSADRHSDEGKNVSDMDGNGFKEYKRGQSRKWRLALLAVMLATIGAFLPPLISIWVLDASKALIILSGTEWVSVVTMVVGLYIGGNVYQKHIERRHRHMSAGISFNASMGAADYAEPGLETRPEPRRGLEPEPGLELDETDDDGREA